MAVQVSFYKEKLKLANLVLNLDRNEIKKRYLLVKRSYNEYGHMFLGCDHNMNLMLEKKKALNVPPKQTLVSMMPISPSKDKQVNLKHALDHGQQVNAARRLPKLIDLPIPRLKRTLLAAILIVGCGHLIAVVDFVVLVNRLAYAAKELNATATLSILAPSFNMMTGLLFSSFYDRDKPGNGYYDENEKKTDGILERHNPQINLIGSS